MPGALDLTQLNMDATAWLTAALAGVTAWMAYETRRMAEASSRALAFEQRPYLAFVAFKAYPGEPAKPVFRPIIVWENKGRVLIHFKVDLIEVAAQNSVPSSQALRGSEGVAFPGVPVEFEGPTIERIDVNQFWKGSVHFNRLLKKSAHEAQYG